MSCTETSRIVKLIVTSLGGREVVKLICSPMGVRGVAGPAGEGMPDPTALPDGQIAVTAAGHWTAQTVLTGLLQIAVVETLPDPQVAGTLYFVKP